MPRDLRLVTPRAMTLADLVEAAGEVDGSLALRALAEGGTLQLVDHDDVAVLSIDVSRQVFDTTDVETVLGAVAASDATWWTTATAPWGPSGQVGVRVVDELAVLLGASTLVVEER